MKLENMNSNTMVKEIEIGDLRFIPLILNKRGKRNIRLRNFELIHHEMENMIKEFGPLQGNVVKLVERNELVCENKCFDNIFRIVGQEKLLQIKCNKINRISDFDDVGMEEMKFDNVIKQRNSCGFVANYLKDLERFTNSNVF